MNHDLSAAADPVGMLAEEFVARYRDGERPPLSEYTDKYPEHAERIRVRSGEGTRMVPDGEPRKPAGG